MNSDAHLSPQLLPTAKELRLSKEELGTSEALSQLLALFDDGTFVETGTYVKRKFSEFSPASGSEYEGVICGYGSIDGALVFAFAQDIARLSGALDEMHAKKIAALYDLALKARAPLIGIFDSTGLNVRDGISALSAYGSVLSSIANASGKIPQIALILGECRGIFAGAASMFDFIVREKHSVFEAVKEDRAPLWSFCAQERFDGVSYIRELLAFLPSHADGAYDPQESADSLNRRLPVPENVGDGKELISLLADNAVYTEVFSGEAPEAVTAFMQLAGVKCGAIVSSYSANKGRLTPRGAKKLSKFIAFCDRYSIPILTVVNSAGLAAADESSFATSIGELSLAYAASSVPKVTLILGKAIGASAVLLGSKSLGADIVYALEDAEIGALPTSSSVAFAWNESITTSLPREELEKEWRRSLASPVAAASLGEVDDIIAFPDIRKRLASALLMLTVNSTDQE